MMGPTTVKLFLPHGDPKRLRTAEITNWIGKAIVAPRQELQQLLSRPELMRAGVYILIGRTKEKRELSAYVGEAVVVAQGIHSEATRDFWSHVIVFVSNDENLAKYHIVHLASRLREEIQQAGRLKLVDPVRSDVRLAESDEADMDVFLAHIRQLLPALGADILTPVRRPSKAIETPKASHTVLYHEVKGLKAQGAEMKDGFVVFRGSEAALDDRPSITNHVRDLRKRLMDSGVLVRDGKHLRLTDDVTFTSASAAAGVLEGGGTNGLTAWRDASGKTLREIKRGY